MSDNGTQLYYGCHPADIAQDFVDWGIIGIDDLDDIEGSC